MQSILKLLIIFSVSLSTAMAESEKTDNRIAVEMPEAVQEHFLKKMREHLESLDAIIAAMADEDLELAAGIADDKFAKHGGKHGHAGDEAAQGKSDDKGHQKRNRQTGEHGSGHNEGEHDYQKGKNDTEATHNEHKRLRMGQYMPEPMKMMGQSMHEAAIEFSVVAREGDTAHTLRAFSKISASCVACHQAYRITLPE